MSYVAPGYWDAGYAVEDGGEASAVPANSVGGAVATSSNAAQTHRATPADAVAGATVTSTFASHGIFAMPSDCVSGSTVTASNAPQNHQATPANANGGATVTPSHGIVLSLAPTFPVAHYPDFLQRAEYPVQ